MRRQLFTLALTALAAALPQLATAQTNVLKAYNDFRTKHAAYITNIINEDGQQSTYEAFGFMLPKDKASLLKNLRQAFDQDKPSAYSLMQQSASVPTGEGVKLRIKKGRMVYENKKTHKTVQVNTQSKKIATGDDLKRTVTFGDSPYKNYTVLWTRDKADSLYRRVVALEWWETDGKLAGCLYNIYSRDPQKVKKESKRIVTTINPDGSIERYDSGTNTTRTYMRSELTADDYRLASASNATEFLSKFGNLRAAYLDAVREQMELTYRTSLTNRIVSLCQNSASVLSADERLVCTKAVEDMIAKTVDDSYLISLLQLAKKALK